MGRSNTTANGGDVPMNDAPPTSAPAGPSANILTGGANAAAVEPAAADGQPSPDSDDEDTPADDFTCEDADGREGLDSSDLRLQVNVSTCVERWRNAGPESRKKMFALFTITGIFVCICRHGHPLVICDMVRLGEL